MARAAPTAPTRRPAAPPPTQQTVYEELWGAVAANDPKFGGPSDNESDQDFYKRLVRATAAIPIDAWNTLTPPAQQWYDDAAGAMEAQQDIEPLPGYADEGEGGEESEAEAEEEGEPEAEAEEEEAPPAKADPREAARQRMVAMNERRKAERTGGNGAAPRKITAPAPRGTPAAAAPAPRRAPAAPPAAPARRGVTPPPTRVGGAASTPPVRKAAAPAPRRESGPSNMELIRQLIVTNQDISVDEIIDYMRENHGFDAKQTTVTNVLTATRATINTIKELGHWQD